jgi:hypothetical protein
MATPFSPPAEDLIEGGWSPPEEDFILDEPTSQGRVSSAANTLGRGMGGAVLDALRQGWQSASRFSPAKIGSDMGKSLASNVGAFSMGYGPEAVPVVRKVLDDMQASGQLGPDPMNFSASNLLAKGAEATNEALREALPVNPAYQQEWLASKIPGAVGQMAGIVLPAVATKGTSVSSYLPRIQGFLLGMNGGYEEADRQGITDPIQRDALAASFGGVEGLTEALGGFGGAEATKRLLGEVGRRGGERFLSHLIKTATTEGGEEAAAGTLQDLAANVLGGGTGEAPPSLALKDMLPKRAEEFALGAIAASPLAALTYAADGAPVAPPPLPAGSVPPPLPQTGPPAIQRGRYVNGTWTVIPPAQGGPGLPWNQPKLEGPIVYVSAEQVIDPVLRLAYEEAGVTPEDAQGREEVLDAIRPQATPEQLAQALLRQQELLSQLRGDAEAGLTDLGAMEGDVLEGTAGTVRPAVLRGTESGLTDLGETAPPEVDVMGGPAAQAADTFRAERRANSVEGMEDLFVRNPEGQWVHVLDGVPTNIPVSPRNQPVLESRWQEEQARNATTSTPVGDSLSLPPSGDSGASLTPSAVPTPPATKGPSEAPAVRMAALQAEAKTWQDTIDTAREMGASPEVLAKMEGEQAKVFASTLTIPVDGKDTQVPAFLQGEDGWEPNLIPEVMAEAQAAGLAPKPRTRTRKAKVSTPPANVQAHTPTAAPPKASRARPAVQASKAIPPVPRPEPTRGRVPAAPVAPPVTETRSPDVNPVQSARDSSRDATQSTEEERFKSSLNPKAFKTEASKGAAWRWANGDKDAYDQLSDVQRRQADRVLREMGQEALNDAPLPEDQEDAEFAAKTTDPGKRRADKESEAAPKELGEDDIQLSASEEGPSANLNSFHVEKVKRELGATKEGRWVLERVEIYETTEQAAKALGVDLSKYRKARGLHQESSGRSVVILNNINLRPGETATQALRGTMVHEAVGHGGLLALVRLSPEVETEMLPYLDSVRSGGWTYRDSDGNSHSLIHEYPNLNPLPFHPDKNPGGSKTIEEKAQREEFLFQEWFARSIESTSPETLAAGKAPSTLQAIWGLFHRLIARLLGRPTSRQTQQFAFDIAQRIFQNRSRFTPLSGVGGDVRAQQDVTESEVAIPQSDAELTQKAAQLTEGELLASANRPTVTAQQDAEYLAAVARGDMETAQRMVTQAANLGDRKFEIQLTKDDAEEVRHKLGVLRDEPELRESFGVTEAQVTALIKSVPINGGSWVAPHDALGIIKSELDNHADVLYDIANDAKGENKRAEARKIERQADKFKAFARTLPDTSILLKDDDDAVIPLSQRFNAKSNDIRQAVNPVVTAPAPANLTPRGQSRVNGFLQAVANLLKKGGARTPSGLLKGRSQMGTVQKILRNLTSNVVDELHEVHPLLGHAAEHIDYRLAQIGKVYEEAMNPAWERVFRRLTPEQDKQLRWAYLEGDVPAQHAIVDAVAGQEGVRLYEAAIRGYEQFYDMATKAGIKLNRVKRYLPTALKNGAYPQMVNILAREGYVDSHGRVLSKAHDWATMTQMEREAAMQEAMNQFLTGKGPMGGRAKSRTGIALDPKLKEELAELYKPFSETVPDYGYQMADAIVQAEMLGPDSIESYSQFMQGQRSPNAAIAETSPVGVLLDRLEKAGELDANDLTRAQELFKARMGYMPDKALAAWMKSGNMALALGNPFSALKQPPAELVKSLWFNGILPTILGAKMALRGQGVNAQRDLNLSPDFEIAAGNDPIKWYNRWVSRMSGFRKADLFPATAMANAYLHRLKQMNATDRMRELSDMKDFLSGTDKNVSLQDVSQKIATDQWTDPDVLRVAFHGITDQRPTGVGTQPLFMVKNNASLNRIAANLKGWPLRNLNKLRMGVYENLRSGDPDKVKEGLGQLSVLATGLVIAGASADALVDWLLGKDVEFEEKVNDNMLKLALSSRYSMDQLAGPQPSAKDAILNYLSTPTLSFVDAAWTTVVKDVKDDEKSFLDFAMQDKQLVRAVPLGLGTMALHWGGEGGSKDRERQVEDRLPDNVLQLTEETTRLKEMGEEKRNASPLKASRWEKVSQFAQIKSWRLGLAKEAAREGDFEDSAHQIKELERIARSPSLWEAEAEKARTLQRARKALQKPA